MLRSALTLARNPTIQLAAAAGAAAGLAWCLRTLHALLAEREVERLDAIQRSKAVAELHKNFEAMQNEKKAPAVDIKWRDTPIESSMDALFAAVATLAKPTAPTQRRRSQVAAQEEEEEARPPPTALARLRRAAFGVSSVLSLRPRTVTPFDLSSWSARAEEPEATAEKWARVATALLPLIQALPLIERGGPGYPGEGFNAKMKDELLSALRECK